MSTNKMGKNIDLLKSTAHDLNNIFTSILNSVELLKIKSTDKEQLQLVQNIENNSLRASEIIDDILLNDADKKLFKLKIIVKILLDDLELTLKKSFGSAVKLEISIPKNINDILGNYSELFRVFLNLCVNAKEAIRENGIIKILVSNFDIANKDNHLKLNNKYFVLIEVVDNGSGISDNNIKKIFGNGFSTKNSSKISGIGLAIVKQIVEAHNGFIEVESELGKGTNFKIYLPAIQKLDKTKSESLPKSVLIAEDTKDIADELYELLKYENYFPTVAYNGETVIDMLEKGKNFNLFIIDKKMPGISGIELIKKIRKKDSSVPIILASGSIPSSEEMRLNTLKINKYLKKPYLFETLIRNIRELI